MDREILQWEIEITWVLLSWSLSLSRQVSSYWRSWSLCEQSAVRLGWGYHLSPRSSLHPIQPRLPALHPLKHRASDPRWLARSYRSFGEAQDRYTRRREARILPDLLPRLLVSSHSHSDVNIICNKTQVRRWEIVTVSIHAGHVM